jgi:hypothetical protein
MGLFSETIAIIYLAVRLKFVEKTRCPTYSGSRASEDCQDNWKQKFNNEPPRTPK